MSGDEMLRLTVEAYGNFDTDLEITCFPALTRTGRPMLILEDKHGYYGFVTRQESLHQLREWLNVKLES